MSGAIEYDALGRPVRAWQPAFLPGRILHLRPAGARHRAGRKTDPTVSRYNALDGPVEEVDHHGAVTRWSRTIAPDRDGLMLLSTVVTDPEGRGSATATDARGQVRINTDLRSAARRW